MIEQLRLSVTKTIYRLRRGFEPTKKVANTLYTTGADTQWSWRAEIMLWILNTNRGRARKSRIERKKKQKPKERDRMRASKPNVLCIVNFSLFSCE